MLALIITDEKPAAATDHGGLKLVLDQADFVDRAPGEMPRSSPEARL